MARIREVVLHHVKLPLIKPYRRSYKVDYDYEPFIAEIRDEDGRVGWSDEIVSTGYTTETPEGAWRFLEHHAETVLGLETGAAKKSVEAGSRDNANAATILVTAIEMLEDSPLLDVAADTRVPLLAPVSAADPARIPDEVERHMAQGFATLKVKVGFDVDDDLRLVSAVQRAAAGRVTLRLDANRGFDREQGKRFAAALDPTGIELFEQPCAMDDWEANAAVAAVSTVPVMLDESIYGLPDIDRAAGIEGVGFVKLKLKKFVSCERLRAGLERIRERGMEPVLGDGVGVELNCWMEACVARLTIRNAGEMNGFLKPKDRLLANPLPFDQGSIALPAGYRPEMDMAALDAHLVRRSRFGPTAAAVRGAAE